MADKTVIQKRNRTGAAAPATLIMLGVIGIIAIATLLFVRGSTVAAHRQFYSRLAASGAASAIQVAQESFDGNAAYSGTKEFTLIQNPDYRVTLAAEVVTTAADGLSKTIRGIGTVYVADVSNTRAYTYDVTTTTIHTFAKQKTPDMYGPIAWYDASDSATIRRAGSETKTVTAKTTFGDAVDATRDTVEERDSDGAQSLESWQSTDLELDACDPKEFSGKDCDSGDTKRTSSGIRFNELAVPRGSHILAATLALKSTYVSTGNNSTYNVCGLYSSTNNQIATFNQNATSQTAAREDGTLQQTTNCVTLKTATPPPSKIFSVDVTKIISEITQQSGWPEGSTAGSLGFVIIYASGEGNVTVSKDAITLSISYGSPEPAITASEQVGEWWDKSTHANHARGNSVQSARPSVVASSNPDRIGLHFENSLLAATVNPSGASREQTVFALIKPEQQPAASISESPLISTAQSNTDMFYSLLLHSNTSEGFAARPWPVGSSITSSSASFTCGGQKPACNNTPIVVSAVSSDNGASITTSIRANGNEQSSVSAQAANMSSLHYNQLYIGGNPASSNLAASYTNGTYYEIIVYDHRLGCNEMLTIENYLREKWEIDNAPWTGTCPAQQIPLL